MNTKLKEQGFLATISYDCGQLAFQFDVLVDILEETDFAMLSILGFYQPSSPSDFYTGAPNYSNLYQSTIPIKITGPSCINVITHFALHNIPSSGRLATIGLADKHYGDLVCYLDDAASQPPLLTSQYIDKITIELTDENNVELLCYEDIPWGAVVSIEAVEDPGFKPMTMGRTNVESLPV